MANPKRKHTHSRSRKRRGQNWTVKAVSTSRCPNCQSLKSPHQVCPNCGFYRDRVVVPVKTKEKGSKETTKK
jgi:large subunit ribosomal protein L32